MDAPQLRLHQLIVSAGIPIEGVSGDAERVRIDFQQAATPEQREQAQQIADHFDWSPRTLRSRDSILLDLSELSAADFKKLTETLILERIASDPDWAQAQGVNLWGDEVDRKSPR